MKNNILLVLLPVLFIVKIANAFTLPWPTSVDSNASHWIFDRHEPASFVNGIWSGRDPIILNEVNPSTFQGGVFADTQGRKVNSTFQIPNNLTLNAMFCGSLYVMPSWALNPGTTHWVRSHIWMRLVNSTVGPCMSDDACALYLTLGITNQNVAGSIQYFNPTIGNVIFGNPGGSYIYYDDYNFICGLWQQSTGTVRYHWNGRQFISISGLATAEGSYVPNKLTEVFLQNRNTNITTDNYWSEVSTGFGIPTNGFMRMGWVGGIISPGDLAIMRNATLLAEGGAVNGFVHNWGSINMSTEGNPFLIFVTVKGYRGFTNSSNIPHIYFNTELGDASSPTDVFKNNGVNEGGQTTVHINNLGGTGNFTGKPGILLIDTAASPGLNCVDDGDKFVLATPGYVEVNDFFYFLICSEADKGWFLQTNTTAPVPSTPVPTPTTPSSPSSPASPPIAPPIPPLSPGDIIGIIFGSIAFIAVLILIFCLGRSIYGNRRRRRRYDKLKGNNAKLQPSTL